MSAARTVLATLIVATALLTAAAAPASANALVAKADPPTWSEEFDGTSLDTTRWAHRATGERFDGFLTPDAVSVADGVLTIKTYTEDDESYSGMISTHQRDLEGFEQTYGYFEARMKFNSAPGQWSAFWLQSRTIGNPIGDPASAGVEMDVVEHRARCVSAPDPTPPQTCTSSNDVTDRIQQAVIWDGYGSESKSSVRLSGPLAGLGNGSWHTYALRWTPSSLTFYVDDAPTWTIDGPISRRSQYIILSSEVRELFAGDIPEAGYGSAETSTTNVQVDWVRVWELPPQPPTTVPANTAAPVASGPAEVGRALACAPGSWSGTPAPAFTYEWLSDGSPIAGATAPTHTIGAADQGHELSCRVRATNTAGSATRRSNAIAVPAAPLPAAPAPPPAPFVRVALPVADTTAPRAALSGRTRQRLAASIALTISCRDEPCRATTTGSVRVPRIGRTRARTYRLRARTTPVAQGVRVTVRMALPAGSRTAIRRALRARRRIVLRLAVEVADDAGNRRRLSRQVVLRP